MELIVKIKSEGSNPYYQDGDVVEAMSLDRIYLTHAEMICNPRNFDFEKSCFWAPGPLVLGKCFSEPGKPSCLEQTLLFWSQKP